MIDTTCSKTAAIILLIKLVSVEASASNSWIRARGSVTTEACATELTF